MSDENEKGQGPVDLKTRLGLHKKLAEIEAARQAPAPEPEPAPPEPLEEATIQRPPRPSQPPAPVAPGPMDDATGEIDMGSVKTGNKPLFVGGVVVATILVLGAGFVIGKAFQLRSLSNVRIENAKTIYQSIFSDEHPLAKKKKIEVFKGFLSDVKDFKEKIGTRVKKPSERDAVLAELSAFMNAVKEYRAMQIDFPARRYATSNFFFIEVLPSLTTLQDQTTRINALADALLQDASLVDFIIRFRKERTAHPERYTHHFWIRPPAEGDIESFATGVRVVKMAQREKVKSNGKEIVEQAIVPENAKNPNEGVLVPVSTIAALSLDSTVKTFEDQTLGRMLGRVMVRLDQLLEATKAVNLKPLETSLQEQASKAPYFVL